MVRKVIWIINQTAGKLDSGWGERHMYLSKYWVQQGYSVKIFSGSHNHLFINQPKVLNSTFNFEKVEEHIEFCWVKNPQYNDGGFRKFWSNIVFTIRLFFLKTKEIQKPEIILVSSMPIFPIICGTFFKKKFKAEKLIFEIRDLWPLTPIYLKGYSKNHPLIKIVGWFEKYAYRKADIIVSLLPNAKDYITNISGDETKFVYIPNGFDGNHLEVEKLPESIINKIPLDKFIIGYTGTIGMANAMEYFIEASLKEINPNIHFVIVGDGYLKNTFKKKVKASSNITFIDKIKKAQVQQILKYFDVCYVSRYKSPLYKYGVSYNKYFDYMLSKKPVLVSSERINDQVELSKCGVIVKPESPEAIIEGIRMFYNMSPEERVIMGERGYKYVKEFHSYDYLSNLYLKLF